MKLVRPVGLVLAGGYGRRMGARKGELRVEGVPLAGRAAAALAPLCAEVLVSVRPGAASPVEGLPAVEDRPPAGRGPLAGIAAGFEARPGAELLVLACDYPLVGTPLLARLIELAEATADVVLPFDLRGRDHPLVALWRGRAERTVARALASRRHRVGRALAELSVQRLGAARFVGLDLDRSLHNVNRPEDLGRLSG